MCMITNIENNAVINDIICRGVAQFIFCVFFVGMEMLVRPELTFNVTVNTVC